MTPLTLRSEDPRKQDHRDRQHDQDDVRVDRRVEE